MFPFGPVAAILLPFFRCHKIYISVRNPRSDLFAPIHDGFGYDFRDIQELAYPIFG